MDNGVLFVKRPNLHHRHAKQVEKMAHQKQIIYTIEMLQLKNKHSDIKWKMAITSHQLVSTWIKINKMPPNPPSFPPLQQNRKWMTRVAISTKSTFERYSWCAAHTSTSPKQLNPFLLEHSCIAPASLQGKYASPLLPDPHSVTTTAALSVQKIQS